ncbi:MAG: hypothetical protein EWM72_01474 [Nitrospira sp.]|nr:MAG: hypothetical protein EWM72_01474 [Nitrospira sp.]
MASSKSGPTVRESIVCDSAMSLSQYLASRISFKAMEYLLMKSARLWPAWASSTLAPTEVADLKSCRVRVRAVPAFLSTVWQSRTISSAN